jgi:hypothetical protein
LEITFDLTEDDFYHYYIYVNHKKGKLAVFNIVIMLVVTILLLLLLFVSHLGLDFKFYIIVIVLPALIALALFRTNVSLMISNNGSLITEHYISIDQEGITEKIKYRTTVVEWGGVRDIIDYKHSIYFLFDNGDASIIPKRAFSNPEAALKFLRIATTSWVSFKS